MLATDLIRAEQPDSRRLIVVLHGLGDSMDGYRELPQDLNLPWLNYLLVNAPEPYFMGFSWFDFPGDPAPGVARSYKLLGAVLDAQRAAGFPTAQTLLFGFSQGCLMAWETGMRYPHRFAGCVGISGFINQAEKLFSERSPVALQQRFLITHGTWDPLIPFAAAREKVQYMKRAGVNVEWHEFPKDHGFGGPAEWQVIRDFICRCFDVAH